MEYEEFKDRVLESVQKELQKDDQIEIHKILRNNGSRLDGLTVLREGNTIAPALYLNDYFEEYEKGCPLGTIVGEITDFYKYGEDRIDPVNMDFYKEFDQVKDHLYGRLVHFERNRENLSDIPHIRIMDLAIVFYCKLRHETLGEIQIQVCNSHLDLWQIQTADLYRIAMSNTREKLPVELKPMNQILREMAREDPSDLTREEMEQVRVDSHMYVLTNYLRRYGAICMLYPGVLSRFAMTVGADLYILPSSVHEVILLPAKEAYEKEKLREVVRQVNETQVAAEDILSDTVYLFSRKMKKILF